MKKALLITSLGFLLASCGASIGLKAEASTSKTILSAFMGSYRMEAYGTQTLTYPEPYAGLSYTVSHSGYYEYGSMVKNGVSVKVVRDSSGLIHYADPADLTACYDTLNAYNEVTTIHEQRWGTDVLFADYYREPFAYVSAEDIDEETLELDPELASFVSASYFGYVHPVEKAVFSLDSYGRATSLDITYKTKRDGLETETEEGEVVYYQIDDSFTSRISFSYNVDEFIALAPSTNSNPALATAFKKSHDNYTLTFKGNALSSSAKYYVTDSGIFFHPSSGINGLADGDVYYHYDSFIGAYKAYTYDAGTLSWTAGNGTLSKDEIILDTSDISDAVFEEIDGDYHAIDDAVYSGLISLVTPYLSSGYSDGYGLGGYVSLDEDGNIGAIKLSFSVSIYTYTLGEYFTDYGTTTLPSYLDIEEIGVDEI